MCVCAQLCLTLCSPMDCILPGPSVPGKGTGVGFHFLLQGIFPTHGSNPCLLALLLADSLPLVSPCLSSVLKVNVLVARSWPTLWDPTDCGPSDSSVHGILQARILEWVALLFASDLPNPGIELMPPALQADSLLFEPQKNPL